LIRPAAALAALALAVPAMAEEVVLGLSKDEVAITTNFDGSEILVFGAVKRETPIPEQPLEVIVAIAGPSQPITVRRKERRFGIWINTDAVEVDAAPTYYTVATTAPLEQVLSNVEDLRHRVSTPLAIRSVGAAEQVEDVKAFREALIRIREASGAYSVQEGAVTMEQDTLFSTAITMPANLTEGDYATRIFLTREGTVVSEFNTVISVRKQGLERWLFTLSRQQPFWYGIMSLAIAIAAGWGASAAFQVLRRG